MSSHCVPSPNRHLIYLVEDEEEVARVVMRVLEDFEFLVEWFRDGSSLLSRLKTEQPDLCILDLGLPDMDGVTLIKQVTALHHCGLLVLTGRGHPYDRVMGLEMGSDDYVVKPFEPRELVARVRSILRRSSPVGSTSHSKPRRYASFLGWTLDCAANTLTSPSGSEHLLSTAETQVLREFVERPHQILTREQLMGQRDLSPMDRSIDVRISRIRRKIEEDPQNAKIIKTVYGAGYMFVAHVTWS
ncbi:response regulator transcription factor [Hydrogenophaga sp.]|uniref:response regulator transcription factor n=1 Tax=Hydrogenophaga sp. TaxID=1904254 RepID=UPI003AF7BA58